MLMKKQLYIIPISAVATFSLLPLNQKIAPLFEVSLSENPAVNGMAAGQILTLGVVAVVLMLTRFLELHGFKFWRLGAIFLAPAQKFHGSESKRASRGGRSGRVFH